MEFYELGSYKEKVMRALAKDEDVVNLVMPTLDDDRFDIIDNFIGGEFKDEKGNPLKLNGHCVDVPFIYATITDNKNIICIDSTITKADSEAIKEVGLVIYVMFHKSNIFFSDKDKKYYAQKGYSGNPVDVTVQAIGRLLNGRNDFGIGKLKPINYNPIKPYYPQNDYYGKTMEYVCSDFMTDYQRV